MTHGPSKLFSEMEKAFNLLIVVLVFLAALTCGVVGLCVWLFWG